MIPSQSIPVPDVAPRLFAERIAILFCAPMMVNGIALPFFPVWLSTLSMNDFEIGIVLSLPMFVRVITAPIAGIIADRLGERVVVLIWSAFLSLLTALALFVSTSFWPVLIIYTLQAAVYGPFVPIAEAIALSGVRRWSFDYGHMRLWGSLAFIVSTMIGGYLIGVFGSVMVRPAMVAGFVLMLAVALVAPRIGRPRRPSALSTLASPPPSSLRKLDLQLMLIGTCMVHGSHAMLFAFSALYWQNLGYSGVMIGVLWSAGVFAEVLFFISARWLRRHINLWSMITFGCAVAVVRWIIFPMDLGFTGYFLLQCLHAFTYAMIHIGIQGKLVERISESQEGAAQGIYFFYIGIFTAIFTLLSGYVFNRYGVHGFYLMSVFALIGLLLVVAGRVLQPQSEVLGGNTNEAS
ncbi:MFS transporter [Pararhizobium sp.]|uniref:MFS transporter n=1 Tax=Pararhizobium sp. TaxID=1977563 RepID=UPI0027191BA6|nr:MFS transporter [Pararhizobium sp.]MDO9418926.1 MFS transporter [Pararhizobium sp.]